MSTPKPTFPIHPSSGRGRPANALFFPAAALYAVFALPLSIQAMLSGTPLLPGLASPLGHAHEMLFGFAVAVVAGFLITQSTPPRLYALFALWLSARVGFVFWPGGWLSMAANVLFAAGLVAETAPRFMRAAKKLRNQVFGPLLIVIGGLIALFSLAGPLGAAASRQAVVEAGVVVFAALLAFMGGRVIAPAVAGHVQRRGGSLEARVQPRLEAAMLVLLLAAAAAVLAGLPSLGGAALLLAGAVVAVRFVRWKPGLWLDRVDLRALAVGYAWLGAGLVLMGASGLLASPALSRVALHAVTVGALGTLTLTVMARTRVQRARQDPARIQGLQPAVLLLSAATVLRLLAPFLTPWLQALLLSASLAWSLAFLLLFRLLLMVPAR